MPNHLASPAQLCQQLRKDGKPCTSPARRGLTYCRGHDPRMAAIRARAVALANERAAVPTPKRCIAELLDLDQSTTDNLRIITVGLMQHVGAGTIEHAAASAILRFARSAAELTPRRRDDSMKHMLKDLLAHKPSDDKDLEQEGENVPRETPPLPPGN